MQNKPDNNNSSFSETITSEEEPQESSKNIDEEFHDENTNFYNTKTSHLDNDLAFKGKILTPKNEIPNNESVPASKKIKKLFLNTSDGNIQNFGPIKVQKNNTNTNKDHPTLNLDQNLSFLNTNSASQTNHTPLEASHPVIEFVNNNNSPIIFNKTVEKFKTLLNNNEKKITEKYQIHDGLLLKKHEKKNLSALFGKEDKEEETHYKQTSEALIKKNHQLQIENYNLRRNIDSDKMALGVKIRKLYEVIKTHFDKSLSPKTKFEMKDLDAIIDNLENNVAQGINLETKSKILHQFDNLRDYYRVLNYFIFLHLFMYYYLLLEKNRMLDDEN